MSNNLWQRDVNSLLLDTPVLYILSKTNQIFCTEVTIIKYINVWTIYLNVSFASTYLFECMIQPCIISLSHLMAYMYIYIKFRVHMFKSSILYLLSHKYRLLLRINVEVRRKFIITRLSYIWIRLQHVCVPTCLILYANIKRILISSFFCLSHFWYYRNCS